MSKFLLFFKVILILPPVWLLNLGSDLSLNNILWQGSADTKIVSKNGVNKVLELTESENLQTSVAVLAGNDHFLIKNITQNRKRFIT